MVRAAIQRIRDMNLRSKLFFTYLVLIAVPFLLFMFLNNQATSLEQQEQARVSSRQVFEQARSYVEYKVAIVKTYLDVVSMNDAVQRIIKKSGSIYLDDYGQYALDYDELKKQFFNAKPSEDILDTQLYIEGSMMVLGETYNIKDMNAGTTKAWRRKLDDHSNTYAWFSDTRKLVSYSLTEDQPILSVARFIPNSGNLKQIIGYVRVDLPADAFTSLLDGASYFEGSSVYLLDEDGMLLCRSEGARPLSEPILASVASLSTGASSQSRWSNLETDGEAWLLGMQHVKGTSMKMLILVPYKEILSLQRKSMKRMMLLFFLVLPLVFPLSLWGSHSTTHRIRSLIATMRSVRDGNFSTVILPSGKDEIGELTQNFNAMLTRIAMLMDEKYQLGQEMKAIELRALQAQINPHFLYNTLDLIYWKAIRSRQPEISELVRALSRFYKLSLSKGEDIVPLSSELDHVQVYVDIQNARFAGRIHFTRDVPDALLAMRIPKITLQPLVENSILHGLLESDREEGSIAIRATTTGDRIILEVEDDGAGIPEDKLGEILKEAPATGQHGYGVHNIHRRIQLLYGESYGLAYESARGHGTTVRIGLPA